MIQRCTSVAALSALIILLFSMPVWGQIEDPEKSPSSEFRTETLEEIQQRIIDQNLHWTAGRTSVSDRGPDAMQSMLGLKVPPEVKARFEKLDREYRVQGLTFPSFFSWRLLDGVTPVKDQGSCGSCWAFAGIAALESMIKIYWGHEYDFSEQQILSCAASGWGCGGGWYDTAWSHLRDNGAVLESCMPYMGNDTEPCVEATCSKYATVDHWSDVANNVEAIKEALMNHGPVATTFTAYGDFSTYTGGCYEHPGNDPINHAVLIVGWDDEVCDTGAWVVKNSWGEDWGKSGYFWIKYGSCRIGSYSQVVYHYEGDDISYMDHEMFDSQGDGLVDPGEWVTISVTMWNEILAPDRTGISAILSTTDPLVTVHVNQANYPDMDMGQSGESLTGYRVSFDEWIPDGASTKFALNITADDGYSNTDSFFVEWPRIRTPYHYVSGAGADVYPYRTIANAAHSIADAINASDTGDSIFVETDTHVNTSFILDRGASVLGAWNAGFTERNLETGKTVIDLNGNVLFSSPDSMAVLDGFILENGEGANQVVPFNAYFGGGVRIYYSRAVVTNCEIRSNAANEDEFSKGIGGGVFAMNSVVLLNNNYIWDNLASKGGGIYLYQCSGSLDSNTVTGNELSQYSTTTPVGGGIYLDECAAISLVGNTIENNLGAENGAGLSVADSGPVTVTGGLFSRNISSWMGGAVLLNASDVSFNDVQFERNNTLVYGGSIAMIGASSAIVTGSRFFWNSASLGAGIYAENNDCAVSHSMFIGNSGDVGVAVFFNSLNGGSFIGNTVDRSVTLFGTDGSVEIYDCDVEIFNNNITNTTGYGLSCSGAIVPTPRYNNVWNNSAGDYNGCTAGEGAISADPFYADTSKTDYHLLVHSSAIDAGDTTATYNDPDGSRGDIGCFGSYMHVMNQPSYPKNLVGEFGLSNAILTWDRNPESDVEFYAVYRDTTDDFSPSIDNFVQFVVATDTCFTEPYSDGSYYRISAVDTSGYGSGYSGEVSPTATGAHDAVVYRLALYQNVPNPFNPVTTIAYELDERVPVRLTIYDVQGRVVRRLVDERLKPGIYREQWNGRNEAGSPVASGIYFYKLAAGDRVMTRKMVLLK